MPIDKMLPRYISHKVVSALKINIIEHLPNPDPTGNSAAISYGAMLTPDDPNFEPFLVPAEYVIKHKPEPGGYWVSYEDGYASFSPAQAFEAGYTAAAGPRCIDPAHRYRLAGDQVLQFLKKQRNDDGNFVLTRNGTTNEELIEVLLDRLRTINAQVPCRENSLAITKLEEANHWLEARTRNRQSRGVEGTPAA